MLVNVPQMDIYNKDGELTTQFLFGENVEVLADSCKYGVLLKSNWDDYTGYGNVKNLTQQTVQTHKINVITAPLFKAADLKSRHIGNLSLNSVVSIRQTSGDYSNIGIGWVYNNHITEIANYQAFDNIVKIAKNFENTPYVWGGKSSFGIDCSGLIQMLFRACGIAIPRDTTQQRHLNWHQVDIANIKPADLVFWDGHIAIVLDKKNIIHANATDMIVNTDSLQNVAQNIKAQQNKDISIILRYSNEK